ncbi:hypothetical protein HDZ31DRAFT_80426 [Schizophyllum fasciatum]
MPDSYAYNEAAIRAYSISIAEHTLKQYRSLLGHHDAILRQQEVALQRQKARAASGRGTPTVHARAQLEKSVHDVELLEARLKSLRVDDRAPSPPPAGRKVPASASKKQGDDSRVANAPEREAVDLVETLMVGSATACVSTALPHLFNHVFLGIWVSFWQEVLQPVS